MRYILVDGTHGAYDKDDWSRPDGRMVQEVLPACGLLPVNNDTPFRWSTALEGLWGKDIEWRVAGMALYQYAVPWLCPAHRIPGNDLLVISFSHGAQVALHAFAQGLKGRLLTINPPVRSDMESVIATARPNLLRWVNLYGDWKDVWAVLGAVGDGHFGLRRQFPQADVNLLVRGPHGAALRDSKFTATWPGWIAEVTR